MIDSEWPRDSKLESQP